MKNKLFIYDKITVENSDDFIAMYNQNYYFTNIKLMGSREKENLVRFLVKNLKNRKYLLLYSMCLYSGLGVQRNINEASKIIMKLALEKDVIAMFYYGLINEDKDFKMALFYYKKASKKMLVPAMMKLHSIYLDNKLIKSNIKKSINYLKQSCRQNDADSLVLLASYYYEGKYMKTDYNKAFEIISRLNKNEIIVDPNILAKCYFYGYGIEKNENEAFNLFLISSKLNNSESQYYLAKCYYKGIGINRNLKKSLFWYNKSGMNNYKMARYETAQIYLTYDMYDPKNAFLILNTPDLLELDCVQFTLGVLYYEGKGTVKNEELGLEMIKKAKDNNYKDAYDFLNNLKSK